MEVPGLSSVAVPMSDEHEAEPDPSSTARGVWQVPTMGRADQRQVPIRVMPLRVIQELVLHTAPYQMHRSFGSGRGGELIRPPELKQEDLCEVLEEFSQHGSKRGHSPSRGSRFP